MDGRLEIIKERMFSSQGKQSLTLPYRLFILACCILLIGLTSQMLTVSHHVLAAGNTVTIHISGTAHPPGFLPNLVTVHVNDTLVFLNDAAETYTIAASDESFFSPPILPGQRWNTTFSTTGTHDYYAPGKQSMVGAIIVAPASVELLSTPQPGAVATAIAAIRAERTRSSSPPPPAFGFPTTIVLILVVCGLVLVGLFMGLVIFMRKRHHT